MERERPHPTLRCVVAVLILSAAVQGRGAEPPDWPGWRGPRGDSVARESGWRPEALVPSPKVLWRANVGYGYSSFCIKGRRVFTMGNTDGVDSVVCLSVDDGREIWRYSYPCRPGSYAGPRATPAYSDSLVYTVSREGLLLGLVAETGKVCWRLDTVAGANALVPRWGIASSARIEGDMLVLNVGKHGLAVDKANGEIIWQSPKGRPGYASSVLYDSDGRRRAIFFAEDVARGADMETGELLWTKTWATKMGQNSADPIVKDGRVFISSIYSRGCTVFDITGERPREVWLNKELASKFGTSVLHEGHLYGVHGNTGRRGGRAAGSVRCLDWRTGEVRWRHDIGFSSLIMSDGKLVILTEEGTLVIAEAAPEGYRELARGRVLSAGKGAREAKGKCWTAPVICRGMAFCRNDKGDLVCVDMR
ncbi:MAG: PQQ-binding-like beta-propeller repeat protein [Planctomycetota bacterium]|jgi:outer membrane protein assembly factor BamB